MYVSFVIIYYVVVVSFQWDDDANDLALIERTMYNKHKEDRVKYQLANTILEIDNIIL